MKIKTQHKLRKPTGAYVVGCAYGSFDYTPANADAPRTIPVLIYYPASSTGEGRLRKYIHEQILPGAEGIETNTYVGAPMIDGKLPLLLFSHGMTLSHEVHTVQCEEMASHGYIVVSIGHPGGGSYELPNGELLLYSAGIESDDGVRMKIFADFSAWMSSSGKSAPADEHHAQLKIVIDNAADTIESANLWLRDSVAAIDWILAQAEQAGTVLYEHVDADKVGAFGMSFGGATAMSLTYASDVIKAAVNLDGLFYSTYWEQPLPKPTLLMNNDSNMGGFLRHPFLSAQGDSYLALIETATHGSFIDYTDILSENHITKIKIGDAEIDFPTLGSIDPDRMETIMNTFLLDFFDKYLKGKPSRLLDTENLPEDVQLLRRLRTSGSS